ncbi:MAG: B12-binding domain-containing radical SAM protein, partial [Candidatus Rokubacteria bacterium]|nr:B12-binding domain-containing radical SAM protein [Candidatus Rokubacteria bacterium]
MEFLFIYPPNARQTHILPMGLAYIGAILMKAGHKVKALDIDAYRFSRQE